MSANVDFQLRQSLQIPLRPGDLEEMRDWPEHPSQVCQCGEPARVQSREPRLWGCVPCEIATRHPDKFFADKTHKAAA